MTKFKEGTWVYSGDEGILRVRDDTFDWPTAWKELKFAPNLEVVEKKVMLSEVEPKARMKIQHESGKPIDTILAVDFCSVCVRAPNEKLRIIHKFHYDQYEVVSTPEGNVESCRLSVEDKPENKWHDDSGDSGCSCSAGGF